MNGQISVSGSLGEHHLLTYSLVATSMPELDSLSITLGYRSAAALFTGGASAGTGFKQLSAGMSGGIVVHAGGITLTNQMEDTIALVSAKGARGARLRDGNGNRIDGNGYAVLPYLSPYRMNEVSIDLDGLPIDVELSATSQRVAPFADSVVLVKFDTTSGRPVVYRVTAPDGKDIPFGAAVLDESDREVALAGQDGRIFIRTAAPQGRYTVKWADGPGGQCAFEYNVPAGVQPSAALTEQDAQCLPPPAPAARSRENAQ